MMYYHDPFIPTIFTMYPPEVYYETDPVVIITDYEGKELARPAVTESDSIFSFEIKPYLLIESGMPNPYYIVNIYWSSFELVQPDENQFMVYTEIHGGIKKRCRFHLFHTCFI